MNFNYFKLLAYRNRDNTSSCISLSLIFSFSLALFSLVTVSHYHSSFHSKFTKTGLLFSNPHQPLQKFSSKHPKRRLTKPNARFGAAH